ncbi:MAG: MscL family protein, partial [Hyphomonas sp.]
VLRAENPATEAIEKVAIQYGAFLNTVIQFLIVAWVVFMVVKGINVLRRQEAAKPDPAPSAPTATESLLIEIRDELKARPKV